MADTGYKLATNIAQSSGWENAPDVLIDNHSYTTYYLYPDYETSNPLTVTGFGFEIPTDATIDGIQVLIDAYCPGDVNASYTRLVNGAYFTAYKSSVVPSSYGSITLGGANDSWGFAGITPSIINSDSFGVRFVSDCPAEEAYIYIDSIQLKVYYTPAAEPSNQELIDEPIPEKIPVKIPSRIPLILPAILLF